MTFESRHSESARADHETRLQPRDHTWYAPILHSRTVEFKDVVAGSEKFLRTLWLLADPTCSITFYVATNKGAFSCGLAVRSWQSAQARRVLESLVAASTSIQPWLGFGPPTRRRPWRTFRGHPTTIAGEAAEFLGPVTRRALAWPVAVERGERWLMTLRLDAPAESSHKDAPSQGWALQEIVDDPPPSPVFGLLQIHGKPGSRTVPTLLLADNSTSGRLLEHPDLNDRFLPYPEDLVSHLLATPARLPGILPEVAPAVGVEAVGLFENAPSPHTLLVGATGQGKSTALAAIGKRDLRRGHSLVVVDVHDGDLVQRLHEESSRQGRPSLLVLLGKDGDQPVVRLADPPVGVSADQHVEDLWSMLRHDVWAEMPEEYFGPVGERATRTGLALAVKDPARQFGLSDIPRLIDPADKAFRNSLLARIDDPALRRSVQRELLPMAMSKDLDNTVAWMSSKFMPFAGATIRQILQGNTLRVPVEEALDRGWSLFIHAPAASLGDQPSRVVVATILHRVWGWMKRTAHVQPVTLVLDEWQKYATRFTGVLLSEGRKYGARLVMANQNLSQLARTTQETVLSNIGALGCYRVGPADAAVVDGLFPTIPERILQTLPRHTMAVSTFERDVVVAGPAPLPAPSGVSVPWGQTLAVFWGGEEPPLALPDKGLSDDAAADDPDEASDSLRVGARSVSFVDEWLEKRAAVAQRSDD